MEQKIFVSYATFSFTDKYWSLPVEDQQRIVTGFCKSISGSAAACSFYQVFPSRADYDLLAWTTTVCEGTSTPDLAMQRFAAALSPFRHALRSPYVLCGMTKPSVYVRPRENTQEIDPFNGPRERYFVVYPFTKTSAWYLKPREERQEMMNVHMKTGRRYPQIKQLLLYSFGIQDQEFVVAYEMQDLALFSDLVQELRSTEARAYTLNDTPIITGLLRTPEQLADIFASGTPATPPQA